MTEGKRIGLEVAERQLDRLMGFFPRIDSKVSSIFAIISGQIAVMLINVSYKDLSLWWVAIPLCFFSISAGYTILNLYRCAHPSLEGGEKSLVYFVEISKLREADYIEKYKSLTEETLSNDIVAQIWRNAEILNLKYGSLKRATLAIMLGTLPWALVLLASALQNTKIPSV